MGDSSQGWGARGARRCRGLPAFSVRKRACPRRPRAVTGARGSGGRSPGPVAEGRVGGSCRGQLTRAVVALTRLVVGDQGAVPQAVYGLERDEHLTGRPAVAVL